MAAVLLQLICTYAFLLQVVAQASAPRGQILREVEVFVDLQGRLHWNGELFEEQGQESQPPDVVASTSAPPSTSGLVPSNSTSLASSGLKELLEEETVLGSWQGNLSTPPPSTGLPAQAREQQRRLTQQACSNPPEDAWWPTICDDVYPDQEWVETYEWVAGDGTAGSGMQQLNAPYGLFSQLESGESEILIADSANNRIQVWVDGSREIGSNQQQTVVGVTGEASNGSLDLTRLNDPRDLGVLGLCRDIFIADRGNHRIIASLQDDPTQGLLVAGTGEAGSDENSLDSPSGLHIMEADSNLYIADTGNHRIVLWVRKSGVDDLVGIGHVGTQEAWGFSTVVAGGHGQGGGLHQLDSPLGVFVDANLNVFIADTGNDRIVLWRNGVAEGQVIVESEECNGPMAIFVDSYGVLFAACSSMHCVRSWEFNSATQTYQLKTTWLGVCGTAGSALTELDRPSGVFVDVYGNVLATDFGNNRVMKRGQAALTQWIVVVAQQTSFTLSFDSIDYFTDLDCSTKPSDETLISSSGAVQLPWEPACSVAYCQRDTVFLGMRFLDPIEVRCVKLKMTFASASPLALSSRYWAGLDYTELYVFGGIVSGQEMVLKMPRFDDYDGICLKGSEVCVLTDVLGDWQASGDRVMIKQTNCDATGPALGFPQGGISSPATADGTTYRIGEENTDEWISATSRSDYVMCWCDSRRPVSGTSCSSASDFKLKAADLTVQGPESDQQLDAWRGQPLVLANLQGIDFAAGDTMVVIAERSCGPNTTENLGFFEPETTQAISNPSVNGLDYWWGSLETTFVKAMVGNYTLCWCRPTNQSSCATLSYFRASAGQLLVNGPTPGQNFICVKGLPCSIELTGINLELGDRIMTLATCGRGTPIDGFPVTIANNTGVLQVDRPEFFSWGEAQVDATAGLYYVCWCSVRYTCGGDVSNFRAEVGVLSVYGPDLSNFVCVLGRECSQYVSGVGLQPGDRMAVIQSSSSCGDDAVIAPRFPGEQTGISFASEDGGSLYRWGLLPASEYDVLGEYTLCWCNNEQNCTDLSNYRAKVGQMTAKGPKQVEGETTRGAGRAVVVELQGQLLEAGDSMVMVTQDGGCGPDAVLAFDQFVVDTIEGQQDARSETPNGERHTWTRNQVPNGGQFLMCWCAVECTVLENFNVYVGRISLEAPTFTDELTECTSGEICETTTTGFGLETENRVILLTGGTMPNPCLNGAPVPGVPNGGISTGDPTLNATTEDEATAVFRFGSEAEPVLSTGGKYQTCWCPSGCQTQSSFGVFITEVLMTAPLSAHSFTCWNGQPCSITDVRGVGLRNGDYLRIALSCSSDLTVSGLPNEGISRAATLNGTAFEWSSEIQSESIFQTSSPREYELCWCPAVRTCTAAGSFSTLIGSMTVGGPFAAQQARCYLGYGCPINKIQGLNLRRGDRMVVKVGCTSDDIVRGSPLQNETWIASSPGDETGATLEQEDLSVVDFGTPTPYTVSMPSGNYRMCWCPANAECKQLNSYIIDVGLIVVGGPNGDQVGWVCVPGFSCLLGGSSRDGNAAISGVGLADNDRLILLNVNNLTACGAHDVLPLPGSPNQGVSQPATEFGRSVQWSPEVARDTLPGHYTVCWCPAELSAVIGCDEGTDFNAQAGTLTIAGPFGNQFFTCFVGSQCQLNDMLGEALQDGDRVIIVGENSSCGAGAEVATQFSGDADGDGMSSKAESAGRLYTFSPIELNGQTGGNYRICWCAASRSTALGIACTNVTDLLTNNEDPVADNFVVEVGTLFIPGIPNQEFLSECTSGLACSVSGVSSISAISLVDGAQIKVLQLPRWPALQGDCQIAQDVVGFPTPPGAISYTSSNNGQDYHWGNQPISVQGGTYLMCWRPNAQTAMFQFIAGRLDIVGPTGGQEFLCTLGRHCMLDGIDGLGLRTGDWIRVYRTCGDPLPTTGLDRRQMSVDNGQNTAEWPASLFDAVTPGTYTVCWCSQLKTCSAGNDYATELSGEGGFTIRGPLPGQSQQCDRGFACVIREIAGIAVVQGDQARILVECGAGQTIGDTAIGAATVLTQGTVLTFNFSTIYERSGIYRICWCEFERCQSNDEAAANFAVEIGILTLRGPYPSDTAWQVVWGEQQNIILEGVQLNRATNAELRIMERCGQCDHTGPGRALVFDRPHAKRDEGDDAKFTFNASTMKGIIPARLREPDIDGFAYWDTLLYCLCWCLGDTDSLCSSAVDYTVEVQPVQVVCPRGAEPFYLPSGVVTCNLCEVGKYKDVSGNNNCTNCAQGEVTDAEGSKSVNDCYCQAGMFKNGADVCQPCPQNFFCIGGVDEFGIDEPQQPCPEGSGAWPKSVCPDCIGAFPAQSVESCSCRVGYAPSEDGNVCEQCQIGFKKNVLGNTSCALCSDIIQESTTETLASSECACGPGSYMVYENDDDTGDPLLCARCPVGWYCANFDGRIECEGNRSTRSLGANSSSDCLCNAGYYLDGSDVCTPCAAGGTMYKSMIGNEPCSEPCPANSRIPDVEGGFQVIAAGRELCICDTGYRQDMNLLDGSFVCIPWTEEIIQETANIPAVTQYLTLEGTDITAAVVEANLDLIRTIIAAQLGLSSTDRVCIRILNVTFNTSQDCAIDNWDSDDLTDISNTIDLQRRRLTTVQTGVGAVRIRVFIWQSFYSEAVQIQRDFNETNELMSGATLRRLLNSTSSSFDGLTEVYYENAPGAGSLTFMNASCPDRMAIRSGRVFEGQAQSCECKPGYEPVEYSITTYVPEDEDYNQQCVRCRSDDPRSLAAGRKGKYKDQVSNDRCLECPSTFGSTSPRYGATKLNQCICQEGQYREGATCLECPVGFKCLGDEVLQNCTDFTTTDGPGKSRPEDCVCLPGYYLFRGSNRCEPCDEEFYKPGVGNGTGNCPERCGDFGTLASSDRGARTALDCFCQPGSFMSPAPTDLATSACVTCPATGVQCDGYWLDNTTDPKVHMPPRGLPGFWIVDSSTAAVRPCRTVLEETATSVCIGSNLCADGHEGLICGVCSEGWTRDEFPSPCRQCNALGDTSRMLFQVAMELTVAVHWNEFLTISSLMKSEVQKNILTVLLRMYTHWAIQVSYVNTVDLSDLSPMDWSSSVAEQEAADAVAVNSTDSAESEEPTLPWPTWHQDVMARLLALKDTMPSIGSTQEVLECLIDTHYLGGARRGENETTTVTAAPNGDMDESQMKKRRKAMKLLGPALYWLFYPVLMVMWVLMFAWLQSRIFLPVFRLATGEYGNLGDIINDQMRNMKNLILKKKPKENQGTKGNSTGDHTGEPLSDSSSDEDWSPQTANSRTSRNSRNSKFSQAGQPRAQDWEEFGTSLNQLVIQPNRFSRLAAAKAKDKPIDIHNDDKEEQKDYYFFLYRAGVPFWSGTLLDVAPWIVVTLNNVWLPVTNRLLQLVYCEVIIDSVGPKLMKRPDVECFVSDHINLAAIALTGGIVWSVGILLGIYTIISRNELQSAQIQRSFGYLLEGYEPSCWSWELSVKKLDLLATALITYTSIAPDNRSKMILYAAQAWVVITIQISYNPYDNRQVNLLDRIENLGLYGRACLFNGVALVLLIDSSAWISWAIAIGVVLVLIYFLGRIVLHASDDWVTSQWTNVILAISLKRKLVERNKKRKKKGGDGGSSPTSPARKKPKGMKLAVRNQEKKQKMAVKPTFSYVDRAQALRKRVIGMMRQWLFFADYRSMQLLRFTWRGPSSDAVFHMPSLLDGYDRRTQGPPGMFTEIQLHLRRWVFHLDQDAQLDFAVGTIGDFMNLLVVEARFHEIPARLTDVIMLLAASVKRLKHEMVYNPKLKKSKFGTARLGFGANSSSKSNKTETNPSMAAPTPRSSSKTLPPEPTPHHHHHHHDEHDRAILNEMEDEEQYKVHGQLGQLKAMMLREVIERSQLEVNERRRCLEILKVALKQELEDRGIPEGLAWQVLDRLSTQQLQSALPYPNQLLLRIQAIATIFQCEINTAHMLQYIHRRHAREVGERVELLRFLEYSLGHILENDALLMWDDVKGLLDHVPVEDLRKFTRDGEMCASWARQQHDLETKREDEYGTRDSVSVEDLNGMLMFIQKFPFEELQELLEYAQVLLDYLTLPNTEVWSGRAQDEDDHVEAPSAATSDDINNFTSKLRGIKGMLSEDADLEVFDPDSDIEKEIKSKDNMASTKASSTTSSTPSRLQEEPRLSLVLPPCSSSSSSSSRLDEISLPSTANAHGPQAAGARPTRPQHQPHSLQPHHHSEHQRSSKQPGQDSRALTTSQTTSQSLRYSRRGPRRVPDTQAAIVALQGGRPNNNNNNNRGGAGGGETALAATGSRSAGASRRHGERGHSPTRRDSPPSRSPPPSRSSPPSRSAPPGRSTQPTSSRSPPPTARRDSPPGRDRETGHHRRRDMLAH